MSEGFGQQIAAAYAADGPAIDLGRGVHEGKLAPEAVVQIPLRMMNRHGLVAGATGTGKTVTLQTLAEQLSAAGVSVFAADVKGDVSGIAVPGEPGGPAEKRMTELGLPFQPSGFPVEYLSLGGLGPGVPVRATVTDFGPQLLAKILKANQTQEESLGLVFHYADEKGLPLLDLSDLRALLTFLESDAGKGELEGIGGLASSTVGVLLRGLVGLEDGGGTEFFGEPQLDIQDLIRTGPDGRGVISVLELPSVQDKPRLFSTALMWLLAELFEQLPEAGDLDKPKLVFFFDEAHLLFSDATDAFLESVTQTVRLIRSKGVGVFFVTQVPDDVPSAGARPARPPRPARAARLHARRRQGAQGGRLDLSEVGPLRRRGAAHLDGHRRGGRDEPLRRGSPHRGRPHPPAGARLPHRPGARRGRRREGLPALREVRHAHGGRERPREARVAHGEGDGARRREAARQGPQGACPLRRDRRARRLPHVSRGEGDPAQGAARRLRDAAQAVLTQPLLRLRRSLICVTPSQTRKAITGTKYAIEVSQWPACA